MLSSDLLSRIVGEYSLASTIILHQQLLLLLLLVLPVMMWSSGDRLSTCEYVVVSRFIAVSQIHSAVV